MWLNFDLFTSSHQSIGYIFTCKVTLTDISPLGTSLQWSTVGVVLVPETSLNLLYLCVVTVNQVSSTTVVCFSDTCLHNKRSSSCCNHIYILYNILYMILNSYQSLSPTQISFYHCKHPCLRGSYNGTI